MAKSGRDARPMPLPEVGDVVGAITEGGLITVPIRVAMLEPPSFIRPVQVAYTVDGAPARLIERLQHGLNAANVRTGDGKYVRSIASVLDCVLDQIAAQYAAEAQSDADADDGLRTYNIQLAVMEPPSGIRPITVWKQLHGLRAKTLQRLRAGLQGCGVRRIGGKQINSHDAVVKHLFEQVQAAVSGRHITGGLLNHASSFDAAREIACDGRAEHTSRRGWPCQPSGRVGATFFGS